MSTAAVEKHLAPRKKAHFARIVGVALGAAFAVYLIFPVYWLVAASIKVELDQFAMPPVWVPTRVTLDHYAAVVVGTGIHRYMANSVVIGLSSTVLTIIVATLAAYGLSRYRFPGRTKDHLLLWCLSARMFPPIVTVLPFMSLFKALDLLNTRTGLVIVYSLFNLPFAVWLLYDFLKDVPREIEELALVDGLGRPRAFLTIVVPIMRAGFGVTGILCFVLIWNEFLYALIFAQTEASFTVPIAVAQNVTQYSINWGQMSAAGTIATLPVVALAFIVQRFLARGLSLGAVRSD